MRIITTADDFGLDDDTVRATIECLDNGSLTSATIMPQMPGTLAAVEYARAHPEKSFGVHLTYVTDTVEAPICDPATLPTLCGPDHRFLESNTTRMKALRGRLDVEEIERETAAQIQRLTDLGVRVSHVDSHGHLHKFKPFRTALSRVLKQFGISRVRSVQDLYLKMPLKSPTFWLGFVWRRKLRGLFTTTERFFMPTSGPQNIDLNWPSKLIPRLSGETIEVGVHPGYTEPWRDAERRTIQDFHQRARAAGHHFIGWRDL